MTNAAVEFRAISKGFFGVPVVRDVSFAVRPGTVVGLIGENGAGKSTLMNMLGGVLAPDAGMILLDGQPYAPRDSREAARRGVAFIHQELNLFTNLTVADNLHLPVFPKRRVGPVTLPLVDRAAMRERSRRLMEAVELEKSPDTPIEELSPGERQLVEIARAVGSDAKVIIFDEPTTSLTFRESQRLFSLVGRLRSQGVAIIYVSHQLEDVQRLCDELVILRDGQVVESGPGAAFTVQQMIALMVGRTIQEMYPPRRHRPAGPPLLEAQGLTQRGVVEDVSFTLHGGEILGLGGLMGAGRTELVRILFGLDRFDGGSVRLMGRPIIPSPGTCIARGMAMLTENRREEGLMIDRGVLHNIALASLPQHSTGLVRWLRGRSMTERIDEVAGSVRLDGAAARSHRPVRTLSGGNQQKVVLAKWLMREPRVFILDEPTRGIDVGAKSEIYRIIHALAEGGAGILLVSSELEELLGMCDRVMVMRAGRLAYVAQGEEMNRERIMAAAFGGGGGGGSGSGGGGVASA